jgi:hypothetical protein
MGFFVVPTIGFDLLDTLIIVRIDRRDLVWIDVTKNPTAEWVARQVTEAFPSRGSGLHDPRPRSHYGGIVTRRLRAIGIRDRLSVLFYLDLPGNWQMTHANSPGFFLPSSPSDSILPCSQKPRFPPGSSLLLMAVP